jgi:hypothetical protein
MGIRWVVAPTMMAALVSCGGKKKPPEKPTPDPVVDQKPPPPPPETEHDRELKRRMASQQIVPEGSTCLPPAFKDAGAPALEIAAVGNEPLLCAVDTERLRLLGPIACWKVDLNTGGLTWQDPKPLVGHDIDVKLDGACAREYCLPDGAKAPDDKIVHMVWSASGKVAVIAGDDVHVFDAASKAHESQFSIRGDKGPTAPATAISWVADTIVVEAGAEQSFGAWMYRPDGTAIGPISATPTDGKPLQLFKGSLLLLNDVHIAVAEQGFTSVTEVELDGGKRTKLVRRVSQPQCRGPELADYWKDGDKVTDRCRESMARSYEHLIGATGVETRYSLLVVLRGPRTGELAVLDKTNLAEKKAIKLPFCDPAAKPVGDGGAATPDPGK